MKRRHNKRKRLLSGMFAFLMTLSLVLLFICIGLSIGVFNTRSITTSIDRSDYHNEVFHTIREKNAGILSQAGLPEELLSEIITLERVYVGGKNYVSATLKNEQPQLNYDHVREDIVEKLKQYIETEGVSITPLLDDGLDMVADAVLNEYKNGVQLQFVNYFMEYRETFNRGITFVVPILLLVIGSLGYILFRMQRYKHRGLRYITYAVIAASALVIFPAAYMLFTKGYQRIEVGPDYYYDFISYYLKWDITVFAYIGVMGAILSTVLGSLVRFMKSRLDG